MENIDVIYINNESSHDRRLAMEDKLGQIFQRSEYTRFPAILGDERVASISNNELGCFLSHQKVIESSSNYSYTLVLEDDVVLASNFKHYLREIIKIYTTSTEHWDILFLTQCTHIGNLQATYSLLNLIKSLNTSGSPDKTLKIINSKSYYASGCVAYVLNPRSKRKIITLLEEYADAGYIAPIDICLMRLIERHKILANFVFPYIAGVERNIDSTIQPTSRRANSVLMEDQLNLFFIDSDLEGLMRKYNPVPEKLKLNYYEYIASQIIFNRLLN